MKFPKKTNRDGGPRIVQLLVTVNPQGGIGVCEIDARVPSGMGVMLSDMETDKTFPTKIELIPRYEGYEVQGVIDSIEAAKWDAKGKE